MEAYRGALMLLRGNFDLGWLNGTMRRGIVQDFSRIFLLFLLIAFLISVFFQSQFLPFFSFYRFLCCSNFVFSHLHLNVNNCINANPCFSILLYLCFQSVRHTFPARSHVYVSRTFSVKNTYFGLLVSYVSRVSSARALRCQRNHNNKQS